MPIYEYRCPTCGGQVERLQSVHEAPPECEPCGSAMQRVLSVTGPVAAGPAAPERVPCCGEAGGCDNPKRCCGGG